MERQSNRTAILIQLSETSRSMRFVAFKQIKCRSPEFFEYFASLFKKKVGQDRSATNIEDRENEQLEETILEAVIGANREDRVDYTNDVGIAFVAGIIEQRIVGSGVSCEPCIRVIEENEKVDNDICVSSNIYKPCRSTFQVCKLTEIAMKAHHTEIRPDKPTQLRLANYVFRSIDYDKLYSRFFYADHDINHKHCLIKTVIEEYIQIKCTHIARAKTLKAQGQYIRNTSTKRTHFSGQ